jgi:hypothetical protein
MAGRERIAAVKRARERQARVEAAAVRVAKVQRRVDQAAIRRQRAIDAADARLGQLEDEYSREVHALVDTCGSLGYAAEVLGLGERAVRRALRRAKDRPPEQAASRGGPDGV